MNNTLLNSKILIVSGTTIWMIFQNPVTFSHESKFKLDLDASTLFVHINSYNQHHDDFLSFRPLQQNSLFPISCPNIADAEWSFHHYCCQHILSSVHVRDCSMHGLFHLLMISYVFFF